MAKASSRRLDLRIPADHPIFEFPDGERARIAREWMDMGRSLERLEDRLMKIEQTLGRLDNGRPNQYETWRETKRQSERAGINIKRLEADILSILG